MFLSNICDALRDWVPFAQFQKRENTHGGMLLLVKLQAKATKSRKASHLNLLSHH